MSATTPTAVAPGPPSASGPVLQADDVVMRFGGLTAVDHVSMTVNQG